MDNETRRLQWQRGFEQFDLNVITVPSDGSCFYHAFLLAFYLPYITTTIEDVGGKKRAVNRKDIVRQARESIANSLEIPVDPANPKGKKYYDVLSRGKLAEFASSVQTFTTSKSGQTIAEFSLEGLRETIRGSGSVGLEAIELTSMLCRKNIFILNAATQDVFNMGDAAPLLYKSDRDCVVLLYHPESDEYVGHYELVAVGKEKLITHFLYEHSFITFLLRRMEKGVEATA